MSNLKKTAAMMRDLENLKEERAYVLSEDNAKYFLENVKFKLHGQNLYHVLDEHFCKFNLIDRIDA